MKLCFICVCYNSYDEAVNYIKSINEAMMELSETELCIVFVDNSSLKNTSIESTLKQLIPNVDIIYIDNENTGYFPGVCRGIEVLGKDLSTYDYTIVSNVDLQVSNDFIKVLSKIPDDDQVGVYAPAIINKTNGVDINPKIAHRPTRLKLSINKMIFKVDILYKLLLLKMKIQKALSQKYLPISNSEEQVKLKSKHANVRNIYAAHGSLIVFTKHYFRKAMNIDYPMFLFGEEIYVAESCRNNKLLVVHDKSLVVYDDEHVSTSMHHDKFILAHHVKSLDYIIKSYF